MEEASDDHHGEQNEVVQAQVSIPQDIQQIILSSLPARVVLRFRIVCKFWRDCVKEPSFVDQHLNNALRFHQSIAFFTSVDDGLVHMYTFDPTTMNFKSMDPVLSCRFHMSAPCNGLVCAYNLKGNVEVLNPTMREHLTLPVSELKSQAPFSEYFIGFVHSTKEYKVVSVRHQMRFLTFEVCTIGTSSWRMVRESADLLKTTKAVIANNGMHWLILDDISSDFTRKILSFNLTDESFLETLIPDSVKDCDLELFEGQGKLHLLAMPGKGADRATEIWVANRTWQVWVRMYTYTISHGIPVGTRPYFLHKKKMFYGNEKRLSYIDLEAGNVCYVDMPSGECLISAGMFVESFILPSVTGLVNSTASLHGSSCAGSSSAGPGPSSVGNAHSSGIAEWSSAELLHSLKRSKRNVNMKWKVNKVYGTSAGIVKDF